MIAQVIKTFKYRDLLINLIIKELKVRYRGAVLGYAWSLLNPILMMIVYTVVFSYVVRIKVENYPVFLLCALLPWTFFAMALTNASNSIVDNFSLINKVYFPREIFPISVVLSTLVHLLISMVLLIIFLLLTHTKSAFPILLLPLVIIAHVIFTISLALILSCLIVFFRDLKYILEVLITVWFYSTPIIYPVAMVPEQFRLLYDLNPMVWIISMYRSILLYGENPAIFKLLLIYVISFFMLFIGHYIFQKYDSAIPKTV